MSVCKAALLLVPHAKGLGSCTLTEGTLLIVYFTAVELYQIYGGRHKRKMQRSF